MNKTQQLIIRGDVYYAEFENATGSETSGIHPVVVVQNNLGNYYSSTIIGVVLSSQIKKENLPTHVMILNGGERLKDSMVLAEQLFTIDKQRLRGYVGHLDAATMALVDNAICRSLALDCEITSE